MTVNDFSIEFDLLFNNIASNKAPGLNEYEKSLFLSQAQEILVRGLYSSGEQSFESTEEMTSYLASITKRLTFDSFARGSVYGWVTFDVVIPDSVWYITLESGIADGKPVEVIPVRQDMFLRTVRNPFRGPTRKRTIRLTSSDDTSRVSSLIPSKGTSMESYDIRYVEKPSPVILEDGIEIDGVVYNQQTSTLPENMHRMLLMKAVELAKSAWI